MKRQRLVCLAVALIPLALLLGPAPAWADDVDIIADLDCMGAGACEQTREHQEADPFAGWPNVTMANTGTEPWGDFHS